MFRGRAMLLIGVSVAIAVGAAVVANRWFEARAAIPAAATLQTASVVVAAAEIPLGTRVEAQHLGTVEMLPASVPRNAFRKKEDVIGKVSRASLLPGETLLAERFADSGVGSTLAAVVEKNMRAISVRVDDVIGVSGFLLPGSRVDVLASTGDQRTMKTETILQNVRVLAVDQTAATEKNQPVVVRAVTLEVSPHDAEILTRGMRQGSIQLTLRNPLDEDRRVAAAPRRPVIRTASAPPPAPTITVIRGTSVASQVASLDR